MPSGYSFLYHLKDLWPDLKPQRFMDVIDDIYIVEPVFYSHVYIGLKNSISSDSNFTKNALDDILSSVQQDGTRSGFFSFSETQI